MSKKFKIEFDAMKETAERLERLGGDIKATTERALTETFNLVTPGVQTAIAPHHRTGKTEKSLIKTPRVKWVGTVANVEIGFDIDHGGLPSIFLMYGTPKMKPDKKLYNSIYGAATKKKIKAVQEEIFNDEIRKVMK